jgi:hemerythrin-like domain-containing protein
LDITPGDIRELYAFARDFTDRFHHFKEKEKYLLFGLLAQKMDGAIDAEIGLLRGEHER